MTLIDIKKYYKKIGYINLILSLLFAVFSWELKFTERIIAVIAINIGYHMLYLFFSNIYGDSTKMRMHNKFNNIGGGIMLKLFSIFGMVCSLIIMVTFISNSISQKEYYGFFTLGIPFGLFLGAYSLWLNLNNE